MTVPWTPVLGDIGTPGSTGALAVETATRAAADATLQAAINVESVARLAADASENAQRIAADATEAATRLAADNTEIAARLAAIALTTPAIYANTKRLLSAWVAGTSIAPLTIGNSWATTATFPSVLQPVFSANLLQAHQNLILPSAGGANNAGGLGETGQAIPIRGNLAGRGGFVYSFLFGISAMPAGSRIFIGLNNGGVLTVNPSARVSPGIGVGKDAADANWQLFSADGVTNTKVDLGTPPNTTDLYQVILTAAQNDTKINVKLLDLQTGVTIADVDVTATLPSATVYLKSQMYMNQSIAGTAVALAFINTIGVCGI